ncbi:MAG: hypothetical protein ACW981_12300 [Candidatus Hodarchaeales archaeon]
MQLNRFNYNNSEYTIKKEFYKSKYFPLLIFVFFVTLILIFNQFKIIFLDPGLFVQSGDPFQFLSTEDQSPPLEYLFILIMLFISVFTVSKVQKSQVSPKSLSKIVEKSFFHIEIIKDADIEIIRFLGKGLNFELSWYNTTGPYHKWKAKMILKRTHGDFSLVTQIADYLLFEEDNIETKSSFYKIIVLRELPRHLMAMQYWYDLLQK